MTEHQTVPPRTSLPGQRPLPLPPVPQTEPTIPLTGIALVLAIAGLLLFMAVPNRALDAGTLEARRVELELRVALGELRMAIDDYRRDHGSWPLAEEPVTRASEGARSAGFVDQLEVQEGLPRDAAAGPGNHYRPYLTHGIPPNPLNGSARVRVLAPGESFPQEPAGEHGWVYSPRTGEVRANVSGFLGRSGIRIFDL